MSVGLVLGSLTIGILAAGLGIYLAYSFFLQKGGEPERRFAAAAPGLYQLMFDKWRVDELYEAVILRPIRFLAFLSGQVDRFVVDGLLTWVTSRAVVGTGWVFTRLQSGVVYAYGAVLVVGMAVMAWWFVYPHPHIESTATGASVHYTASPGLGYEYRWDANADGTYDTPWGTDDTSFVHTFGADQYQALALLIEGPRPGHIRKVRLPTGRWMTLDTGWLAPGWERNEPPSPAPPVHGTPSVAPRGDGPPALKVDPDKHTILLRPNGAYVVVAGQEVTDAQIELSPGDIAAIGVSPRVVVGIGAVVAARLQIRNAFGSMATRTSHVVLEPSALAPQHAELEGHR